MKKFCIIFIVLVSLLGCAHSRKATYSELRQRTDNLLSETENKPTGPAQSLITEIPGKAGEQTEKKTEEISFLKPNEQDVKLGIFPSPDAEEVYFEETGTSTVDKYGRMIDCENRARDNAIDKVLTKSGSEAFLGFTDVLAQTAHGPYEFVGRYLLSWARGIVQYEKPVLIRSVPTDDGIKCEVLVKGRIVKKGKPDPSYNIIKTQLDRQVYQEGENVNISLTVTYDSYLYLFSVDEDLNVWLIYPNKYSTDNRVVAGDKFTYPPQDSQVGLKAIVASNRESSAEALHIVTTRNTQLVTFNEAEEKRVGDFTLFSLGDLPQMMKRLNKLNRQEWTNERLHRT